MKVFFILFFLSMVFPVSAQSQCVAEVVDVKQDAILGSIVVETQYTLNGQVVQLGKTRYDDNSGTDQEIKDKVVVDIVTHCEALISRIESNQIFIHQNILDIQKTKTTPIINRIKIDLIGTEATVTKSIEQFRDKEIEVTYDEKHAVRDVVNR